MGVLVTYFGGPNSNVDLSRLPGGQGVVVSIFHRRQGVMVASTVHHRRGWEQGQGEGRHQEEEEGAHI